LAEAGFARGLTVPLAHWPGYAAPWRNYYELTVDNLAQVGITAELKPEDQSRYATLTFLGKFDKMAMGPFGAGVTEIDELLYETFFSGSPRNRSRINDPELDRMLRAQRRELDPARRPPCRARLLDAPAAPDRPARGATRLRHRRARPDRRRRPPGRARP